MKRTTGSEPFAVTGHLGTGSLWLPSGASAVAPPTCVNAGHPAPRFVARNNGLASTVLAQVSWGRGAKAGAGRAGPRSAPAGSAGR